MPALSVSCDCKRSAQRSHADSGLRQPTHAWEGSTIWSSGRTSFILRRLLFGMYILPSLQI